MLTRTRLFLVEAWPRQTERHKTNAPAFPQHDHGCGRPLGPSLDRCHVAGRLRGDAVAAARDAAAALCQPLLPSDLVRVVRVGQPLAGGRPEGTLSRRLWRAFDGAAVRHLDLLPYARLRVTALGRAGRCRSYAATDARRSALHERCNLLHPGLWRPGAWYPDRPSAFGSGSGHRPWLHRPHHRLSAGAASSSRGGRHT